MTWRSGYRSTARAALAAVPRFSGMTILPAWAGSIDPETLPVMGIVTAAERIRPGSSRQLERVTTLQVIIKRQGGNTLEAELDEDADAIEAAVMSAIWTSATPCLPSAISQTLNGEARQRIGTLLVDFEITSWRPAPGT